MALGIKAAGLQAATLQAAMPDTTQQVVIDIAVAAVRNKHQPIGLIDAQHLHLLLVLLQHIQHLLCQWHHSLLACLRGSPAVMT